LLDDQGVIREIYHGRPDAKKLDQAIAKWVKRLEKEP
jgi:hypothetical protein